MGIKPIAMLEIQYINNYMCVNGFYIYCYKTKARYSLCMLCVPCSL